MARRPDYFQRAVGRGDGLAAREQAVGRQPLKALLDLKHGGMHQRAHLGRDAGRGQDFLLPVAMEIRVREVDQQLVVRPMHVERRAGQCDELGGQAHVVRVNVGEQDVANIAPVDRQVRARLGMKPLEAAAATPVPVVEEIVAPKKFEEPPLDEETEHFVTVALTDVDLFSSYGLTPKAIDLLERVILRAPRYTPALEKLLDLHLGEGNNQRTAELAEHLMKILTERGDTANAERFAELSRRFQRASALDPAPAAAPAEFTIPKSDPGIDVSMKAPGDGEPVEEFVIEPTDARAPSKTKAPSPQDSVHELDLSDEWASISGQAGGGSTSEMIPDVEEPEDEREFNDVPAGVESNRSAFVIQEETENTNGSHKTESDDEPRKTHVVSDVESGNEIEVEQEAELQNEVELQKEAPAPEPVPVFANSGSAEHAEEEPAEYELELVEQASQPGSSSNVSPIRVVAEPDASPLGDLAMELGMVLDAAPPVAPSASGNGTARLNQFAKPAAPPLGPRPKLL